MNRHDLARAVRGEALPVRVVVFHVRVLLHRNLVLGVVRDGVEHEFVIDLADVLEHELHLLAALHLDAIGVEEHLCVVGLLHCDLDRPHDGLLGVAGLTAANLVAMAGLARAGKGQGCGQRQRAGNAREGGQSERHHVLL